MPMYFSKKNGVVLLLTVLAVLFSASSCIRVRGPGLMPPVEEGSYGEWVVLSREFNPSRSTFSESGYRLTVALLYLVKEGERSLSNEDLNVLFDDDPISFSFTEADQIVEIQVHSFFGPSLRHSLVVRPAKNGSVSFPILTLALE